MDEAETRRRLIDERLRLAGWDPDDPSQATQELDIDLTGSATPRTGEGGTPYAGHQFADYAKDRAAKVEAFCNRVAAALLMPAAPFREMATPLDAGGPWPDDRLEDLATKFSVSRHAVYVRLVSLGLAKQAQYDGWRAALIAQSRGAPAHRDEGPEREGGPSFYQLYLHRMSFPYLQRVFESYHADQISPTELSDHLGVKPSAALALENPSWSGSRPERPDALVRRHVRVDTPDRQEREPG
jgi:hypothetical protein